MSDKNSLVVKGVTYDLTVEPKFTDALVQAEVEKVMGTLNLNDITDNLYMSVELVFVAYNGVAGAKHGVLQAGMAGMLSELAIHPMFARLQRCTAQHLWLCRTIGVHPGSTS